MGVVPVDLQGGRAGYVAGPLGFSPPLSGSLGGRRRSLWGAWHPRLHSPSCTLQIALPGTDVLEFRRHVGSAHHSEEC
jgi:hypothetical protein